MNMRAQARLSIRTRLTFLYGGALFVAGAIQLLVMYVVVRTSLFRPLPDGDASRPAFPARPLPTNALEAIDELRTRILSELVVESALALVVIGTVATVLGWWLAGRALSPIHQIAETAERVSGGSLDERIALQGPHDELRELADTFDAMLDRLQQSFEIQQRFVANASHELRTPLAAQRTLIEVAMANPGASTDLVEVGHQLLAVQHRSERLIDGLLTLARGEQPHARTSVELADLVGSATAICNSEARPANITVFTELQSAALTGDPDLLDRLVLNLLQNAIRYNISNGWVRIATGETVAQGRQEVTLTIENTGTLVDPASVDSLFDAFRRGQDRIGDGVGLGLSIARTVAAAHGGRISAAARPEGGMLVDVALPVIGQR